MAKEKTPEELAALAGAIGKGDEDGTSAGTETATGTGTTGDQAASVAQPAKGSAEKPQDGSQQLDDTSGADAGNIDGTDTGRDSAGEGGTAVAGEALVSEGPADGNDNDTGGASPCGNDGAGGNIRDGGDAASELQGPGSLSYREFCEQPLDDMPLIVAAGSYQGMFSVCDVIIGALRDGAVPSDVRAMATFQAREMASYVRKIGRRATADVLASHLQIKKMRPKGELSTPERIALSSFISTLLDLDEFIAAERARIERENTPAPKPVPVPLEDTTFEPVDDFFTPTY